MINSVIPKIFGDELQCHLSDLLKENGWDQIMQELLCVTPRRFGKTWAVAMFVAAVLICVPGIEVAIFSMAMRASRKMLGLVDKFVSAHAEGKIMIIKPHNQEFLTLKGSAYVGDERKCYSYPGKSEVCIRDIYCIQLTIHILFISYDTMFACLCYRNILTSFSLPPSISHPYPSIPTFKSVTSHFDNIPHIRYAN